MCCTSLIVSPSSTLPELERRIDTMAPQTHCPIQHYINIHTNSKASSVAFHFALLRGQISLTAHGQCFRRIHVRHCQMAWAHFVPPQTAQRIPTNKQKPHPTTTTKKPFSSHSIQYL